MINTFFFDRKNIFILVITLLPHYAYSSEQEKIDSLMFEINQIVEDSVLADTYNEIAYCYGAINFDSTRYYLAKAKPIALEINYNSAIADNYSYSARVDMHESYFELAIQNFDSALYFLSFVGDSSRILDCLLGKGYVYGVQTKQLHNLECNKAALEIAESLEDSAQLSTIYNNIGSIYYHLDDFENTYYYLKKSIEIGEAINGSKVDIALTYSNLGMFLIKNKKYDEAKIYYDKVIDFLPEIDNVYAEPILHLSLVSYYNAIHNKKRSKIHLDIATRQLENTSYRQLKARLNRCYAEWYFLDRNYEACIAALEKNIAIQQKLDMSHELDEVYTLLAKAYYKNENYRKAYEALIRFKDVLQESESKKVTLLLSEFEEHRNDEIIEHQRMKEEILNHELEREASKLKFKYYIAILLIVILLYSIAITSYNWHIAKKRGVILSEKNKLIESQKQQLKAQLKVIQEDERELKEANATKDKFLSIIAHDLRSPFSSLIGFSELMVDKLEQNNTDQVLNYARLINEVANNSYALLNNLLEWAMEKVGKMSFSPQEIKLSTFMQELVAYFKQLVPDRDICFESPLGEDFSINADYKMMQSILRNLISNAIKYTPQQGKIKLKIHEEDNYIIVAVQDNGIGMNKEQLDHLFNIEYAESTRGLNNEKGTGLGVDLV